MCKCESERTYLHSIIAARNGEIRDLRAKLDAKEQAIGDLKAQMECPGEVHCASCGSCGCGGCCAYYCERCRASHDDVEDAEEVFPRRERDDLRARLDAAERALTREREVSNAANESALHVGEVQRRLARAVGACRVAKLALEGMMDAHMDGCRDSRDEICPSCVMVVMALEDRSPQGLAAVLKENP